MDSIVIEEKKEERSTGGCDCQASEERETNGKIEQAEMCVEDRHFSPLETIRL